MALAYHEYRIENLAEDLSKMVDSAGEIATSGEDINAPSDTKSEMDEVELALDVPCSVTLI